MSSECKRFDEIRWDQSKKRRINKQTIPSNFETEDCALWNLIKNIELSIWMSQTESAFNAIRHRNAFACCRSSIIDKTMQIFLHWIAVSRKEQISNISEGAYALHSIYNLWIAFVAAPVWNTAFTQCATCIWNLWDILSFTFDWNWSATNMHINWMCMRKMHVFVIFVLCDSFFDTVGVELSSLIWCSRF